MKAMILAAGLGTRLRPLTNHTPKPLLPVGGIPLIEWNVLLLRRAGIRDVIINLHHLGNMIETTLGDGSRWDMCLTYSHEPQILGTGGALKAAEWFFEGQPFLVMNGDTLVNVDVNALINFHTKQGGDATLVLRDDPHAERWGLVECAEANRILRINGRGVAPDREQSRSPIGRMFAGVHVLNPHLMYQETPGDNFSIIDTYTRALTCGSPIFGFVHAGYWSDIGTPERYVQAQADVEAGLISLPTFHKG